MEKNEIASIIKEALVDAEVKIDSDGYHYQITVISPCFKGLNKVKRQQRIYQTLHEQITSGTLHAVSIKAFTPDELD